MIFLTGGTGQVGGELLRQLVAAGAEVRVLIRDERVAPGLRERGVDVVVGDLAEPDPLVKAMRGCDHAFLLLPGSPDQVELEPGFVRAAADAGVQHVVKQSVLGVGPDAGFSFGRWHAPGEAALRESGMGWTFIRPNGFCENSLRDALLIKEQGRFYSPLGNARVSWVAVRDLAAIAFAALTEPGHEGAVHTVTGPAALSHGDCAAALAEASGREISYVEVPDEAAREAMTGSGIPGPYADALIELFEWYRQGNAEVVSGDVERVLGRPATTYADWAREHADAFR